MRERAAIDGEPDTAAEESTRTGVVDLPLNLLPQRFLRLRTMVSFALAAAVLVVVFSRLNVDAHSIWERVSRAHLGYYLLGVGVYYLTFVFRSLRWRQLLWNVGFHTSAGVRLPSLRSLARIIILSWFANCIVPAKLGDAYRAYLLKRESQVSFSKTFGTILAERIMDLMVLLVLLVSSALLAFRGAIPQEVASVTEISAALMAAMVAVLLAMRHLGQAIMRFVPLRLQANYSLFAEGTLASFRSLPWVVLLTVLAWLTEAARLYFVAQALGIAHLTPPVVLFVALAAAVLTTLPITPAGLGFVETATAGMLILSAGLGVTPGLDHNTATSAAILDRSISYWSIIGTGLVIHLAGRRNGAYSH